MREKNRRKKTIANGYKADVYALNYNYATYQVEETGRLDTSFTLYDKQTVERIMREDPDFLPPPGQLVKKEIAEGTAEKWERSILQSNMVQSIVQGETVHEAAKRISETLSTRNYAASVRYARTAMTNAQNAGRYDGYRRAKKLGVDLTIEWQATLDNRTRHDPRMLHGQRREVDDPFVVPDAGIKILYPAQAGPGASDIPQREIWNCRCTLLAWVKGFEGQTVKSSPKMGGMSFEEWQAEKALTKEQEIQWIKDGKPKLSEWKETVSYKKVTNERTDRKQFEEYQKILGKNAPKTFAKFQELKYNSGDWELFKAYKRGIDSGELTPLADFVLYKKTSQEIDKILIGQKTVDGLTVKSKSYHFISRTIGSVEQRRSGVSVERSLESLTKGKTREYAKSRGYYIKGNCLVTFNVEKGKLIQVNPY